jgi:hypothetical protein
MGGSSAKEMSKSTPSGDSVSPPSGQSTTYQKTHNMESITWSDEWMIMKNAEDQFYVGYHGPDDLEESDDDDCNFRHNITDGV